MEGIPMADRSQAITIQNTMDLVLTLKESDRGGKWTDGNPVVHPEDPSNDIAGLPALVGWSAGGPPQNIQPGTTVSFGSESVNEILGGTGGHVTYTIQNSNDFIHIYWDVPFFGLPKVGGSAWAIDPLDWWNKLRNNQIVPSIPGSTTFGLDLTGESVTQLDQDFDATDFPPTSLFPAWGCVTGAPKHPSDIFTFTQLDASRSHRRVYDLVWRSGVVAELQYYGLKFADYQQHYDQLFKENWRLYLLNTYVENGQRLYDAVWRPSTSSEMHCFGLDTSAILAASESMWKQNWRLEILKTYESASLGIQSTMPNVMGVPPTKIR
jgi:hypothetical protein